MKFKIQLIALLIVSAIYGQKDEKFNIVKGTKEVTALINFNVRTNKSDDGDNVDTEVTFGFRPSLGFAIKDNLVIGAGMGFSAIREKSEFEGEVSSFDPDIQTYVFAFYPYIKKYIPVGKKLAFNIQGSLRIEALTSEEFNNKVTLKSKWFGIGITPGLTYNLSNKIALISDFGFFGYTKKIEDNVTENERLLEESTFNLSLNSSQLFIGMVFFL